MTKARVFSTEHTDGRQWHFEMLPHAYGYGFRSLDEAVYHAVLFGSNDVHVDEPANENLELERPFG